VGKAVTHHEAAAAEDGVLGGGRYAQGKRGGVGSEGGDVPTIEDMRGSEEEKEES
jgi:hypothetical protein